MKSRKEESQVSKKTMSQRPGKQILVEFFFYERPTSYIGIPKTFPSRACEAWQAFWYASGTAGRALMARTALGREKSHENE